MLRRPSLDTKTHHERWLVSYADFITLLFAFFVVMYSVSQVNENQYRTLSATLRATFNTGAGEFFSETSADPEIDPWWQTFEAKEWSEGITLTSPSESGDERWIEISLNSDLLFKVGSATLGPDAQGPLSSVADLIAGAQYQVSVEGHTDNLPIQSVEFQDNWALSSARALAVLRGLLALGVEAPRLSAIGYGEYRPAFSNATDQGRAKNRRVVLRVEQSNSVDVSNSLVDPTSELGATGANSTENISPPSSTADPVRLENGGLLFSSDPDLPRLNAPVDEQPDTERGAELP